jgi:hypothetical protein
VYLVVKGGRHCSASLDAKSSLFTAQALFSLNNPGKSRLWPPRTSASRSFHMANLAPQAVVMELQVPKWT